MDSVSDQCSVHALDFANCHGHLDSALERVLDTALDRSLDHALDCALDYSLVDALERALDHALAWVLDSSVFISLIFACQFQIISGLLLLNGK